MGVWEGGGGSVGFGYPPIRNLKNKRVVSKKTLIGVRGSPTVQVWGVRPLLKGLLSTCLQTFGSEGFFGSHLGWGSRVWKKQYYKTNIAGQNIKTHDHPFDYQSSTHWV